MTRPERDRRYAAWVVKAESRQAAEEALAAARDQVVTAMAVLQRARAEEEAALRELAELPESTRDNPGPLGRLRG